MLLTSLLVMIAVPENGRAKPVENPFARGATTKRVARRTGRTRATGVSPEPGRSVYYANCSAARAAGAAPIRRGQPGYSRKLDRDDDGIGCE